MEVHNPDETQRLMSDNLSPEVHANGALPATGGVNGTAAAAADAQPATDGPDDAAAAVPDFLCGIALSVYQNAGGGSDTNWEAWENKRTLFGPTVAVRDDGCQLRDTHITWRSLAF